MKFYHDDIVLEVPDNVYYPREDSLLLARVIENMGEEFADKYILDVGCGSGLLAIIAAKLGAIVTAADINPDAVETTRKNVKTNHVKIEAIKSDLFENINGKFDVIIFNPPYLPVDEDISYSGGLNGREVIEKFLKSVKEFLLPNGKIFIVISSLTGRDETIKLLSENGFDVSMAIKEKIPWEELMVLEAKRK